MSGAEFARNMPVELILAPEAEEDISSAYGWYEDRRPGLGEDFLSAVDACLEAIRRQPEMHAVVIESYRRALLRRFPFGVFYEHLGDRVIVYGVFHTSRDPQQWRQRVL
jgi:plasmid stabilization system protein ParE